MVRRARSPWDRCSTRAKRITKANTTFVWASPEFLTAQEIIGEKAKGNFMPIWQPPVGKEAGLLLVSPARARKKGLKFRSLETTIRDTLEWQKCGRRTSRC